MRPAADRFRDAAALFALFTQSSWSSCHVRTEELEMFVARGPSNANPLVDAPDVEPLASTALLHASHLGTVTALARVGTTIVAGQTYARLDLLGDTIELAATESGTIAEQLVAIGALAEYDQPLLALR